MLSHVRRLTAPSLAAALAAFAIGAHPALAQGMAAHAAAAPAEVVVSQDGPVRSIAAALGVVRTGGRVVVEAGIYREPEIVVSRPVAIVGRGLPTLDGQGAHAILTITADDVTVQGLRLAHVGTSFVEDRAALRVKNASGCAILDNQVEDGFFGIYLANVTGCRIERNVLHASNATESVSGNGIHLWSSRRVTIADNRVSGFRDGIYFEFVHETEALRNTSEGNLRYGLHFMYSDDCRYVGNVFRKNGSGVAVMYTKRVQMTVNHFDRNWGSAAYGLLL